MMHSVLPAKIHHLYTMKRIRWTHRARPVAADHRRRSRGYRTRCTARRQMPARRVHVDVGDVRHMMCGRREGVSVLLVSLLLRNMRDLNGHLLSRHGRSVEVHAVYNICRRGRRQRAKVLADVLVRWIRHKQRRRLRGELCTRYMGMAVHWRWRHIAEHGIHVRRCNNTTTDDTDSRPGHGQAAFGTVGVDRHRRIHEWHRQVSCRVWGAVNVLGRLVDGRRCGSVALRCRGLGIWVRSGLQDVTKASHIKRSAKPFTTTAVATLRQKHDENATNVFTRSRNHKGRRGAIRDARMVGQVRSLSVDPQFQLNVHTQASRSAGRVWKS